MDSADQIAFEFLPYLRVYKDGRTERLQGADCVSSSIDSETGVSSKDVIIEPKTGLSARLYLPKLAEKARKLPIIVYFHGGAFCIGSAFSPIYHNHLNSLVFEANVVAVSVEYRLAPEHPLPIAFEDSWAALQWVASHSEANPGHEPWLADYADFSRLYLAGESAGGNISHNMAMRAGHIGLNHGVKVLGVGLIHPYFWGSLAIGSEDSDPKGKAIVDQLWPFVCPSSSLDDPLINPMDSKGPSLCNLGCSRVLVCAAGKDLLKDRNRLYYEMLGKSGWNGVVEILEVEGEGHVFHLFNPTCENAKVMMKRLVSFFNMDIGPSEC